MLTVVAIGTSFLGGVDASPRGKMPREISDITGPYPLLGQKAREFSNGLTARVLARKMGVSYDTVSRIWNGERPKLETLLKFASGLGLSENQVGELLVSAGYGIPKYSMLVGNDVVTPISVKGKSSEGEIERVRDPDAEVIDGRVLKSFDPADPRLELLDAYDGLELEVQPAMLAAIKAAGQAKRSQRTDIIGKRPVED